MALLPCSLSHLVQSRSSNGEEKRLSLWLFLIEVWALGSSHPLRFHESGVGLQPPHSHLCLWTQRSPFLPPETKGLGPSQAQYWVLECLPGSVWTSETCAGQCSVLTESQSYCSWRARVLCLMSLGLGNLLPV